jgi:hypothetical protein
MSNDQIPMTNGLTGPTSLVIWHWSLLIHAMLRILRIVCFLVAAALLAVAVAFRGWDLGRVPGVNGDEAWYGVQAERMLHGGCVSLRTPTGNPWNPFLMAPEVALHAVAEPSFTLLRVPALASGIVALMVNLVLCHRAFGPRTAWLTTLVHAVLPINIAYSRFAWDASQSLLATLPVVYAGVLAYQERESRLRWTTIGLLFLAAAKLVHPTNIFVAPFFSVLIAAAWRDRIAEVARRPGLRLLCLLLLAASACAITALLWPRIAANIGSTANYTAFARRFGDLFSGVTVYEYLSGSLIFDGEQSLAAAIRIGLDSLAIVVAALVAFALQRSIARGRSALDRWLVVGWAASVVSFFVIAGPAAIAPHFERYAICLIAPTVLLLGRGLQWWMRPTTHLAKATAPMLLAIGACLLLVFKSQYFDEFNRHGGRSHLTFRTADVEPKQEAMDLMTSQRSGQSPLLIQTSEWWLYWPLQYLAYAHEEVLVELRSPHDPRPLEQQAFSDLESWIVEFAEEEAGWKIEQAWLDLSEKDRKRIERTSITDSHGRKLLVLLRLPAIAPHNAVAEFPSAMPASQSPDPR